MSQRLSRFRRTAAAGAVLAASLAPAWEAQADPAPPDPPAASDQERANKETELRGVEDTLRASEEQRGAIEAEIESVRADRVRLSAALIDTTAKVQDAERGASAAGDKLASLNAAADELSRSLERRRAVIADVLAALQRMGSNPPPAILVRPNDMSEAVRAATVMGELIPELKSQTESVRNDLDALAKTRDSIAIERDELTQRGQALAVDRMRLGALIDARQQSLASAQDALGSQRQRASELARQATSLKDLIARLDSETGARKAAAAAAHATETAAAAEIEAAARARTRVRSGAHEARNRLRRRQGSSAAARRRLNFEDLRVAGRPWRNRTGAFIGHAGRRDGLGPGRWGGAFRRALSKLRATLDHGRRRGILCTSRRHGSNQC